METRRAKKAERLLLIIENGRHSRGILIDLLSTVKLVNTVRGKNNE